VPTAYDPNILQIYADELYRQAKWIVFTTGLRYAIAAFIFTSAALFVLDPRARTNFWGTPNIVLVWAATALALLGGLDVGRRKSFRLKLEAQRILCDCQIELNTRTHTSASAAKA
jgi:hypothetical protein